ncbi:MAG: hypothetical protein KBD17_01250 [Candidatus Pacebacteria bacterium]|nr:hypothetical protein [Candidatus Paceibacterota bacterium]
MTSIKHKYLCFVFISILSFVFGIWAQDVHAATHVSENITEDTTWTIENSPFVIDNSVRISQNATLNIEPGVVVKFTPYSEIYFYDDEDGDDHGGSIIANGTSENKIYFTSIEDDEAGGDTSENGAVSIPEIDENSNTWYGITAGGSLSRVSFENVVFRYSIYGLGTGKIQDVEIKDSVFEKNYIGISDSGESYINISNTKIINNYDGISVKQLYEAPNSIYITEGLSIYGNTRYGVRNQTGISYQTKNDVNIFDWLVNLFKPNNVLAQEETELENPPEEPYVPPEEELENPEDEFEEPEEEEPLYDYTLDFKNTWWGDASGPFSDSNPDGLGNEVSGPVDFTPFCKNPTCTTRNPVLIVPGLLGTEISKPTSDGLEKLWLDLAHNLSDIGDQFMDALQFKSDLTPSDDSLILGDVIRKKTFTKISFNYTDNLVKEFVNQGYVEGVDLFLFPYDWRFGVNMDNVNKLKQKITDVLTQTGSEKVDIVAHSMGGLITKKYVIENPSEHHIAKAIFIGVPNTGSPKATKNLLVGDGTLITADSEMKKLSRNMPAAYDLVPSEEYINKKGSYIKVIDYYLFSKESRDLDFEESNIFIVNDHDLNAQALVNANNLHTKSFDNYDLRNAGVDLYSINGCKAGTIGKFVESREHGIFGGDGYTINNFKIEQFPGDGTVPLESATNLPINESNKYYALNASHAEMMSQDGIRQKIVNIISGSDLETEKITQDISECKLNGRAISIFSPLAIDIVDQDGNHAGLSEDGVSIENNIPNADFQIIDDHKFVYLPTDNGQTYTINVTGTGTGAFTLTDANINENEITGMQVFSNISVTSSLLGSVNISDNTTLGLDNDGNGDMDETRIADLVLGAEEAQNFIPEPESVEEPQMAEVNNSSGSRSKKEIEDTENFQDSNGLVLGTEEFRIPIFETNSSQNYEKERETEEFESLEEFIATENDFTANVTDAGTDSSGKILAIFISGILILLLVARKFNKL